MVRILLLGCSNLQHYHYIWAKALGHNLPCPEDYNMTGHRMIDATIGNDAVQIYNLSQAGSGNFYIYGRLVEWIHNHGRPDYVFLQFSGLARIDFAFPCNTPEIAWDGWTPQKHYLKTESMIWAFSGGHRGSWQDDVFLKKFVGHFYTPENADTVIQQSLGQVAASINFCKSQKIAMNWCFYYNVCKAYNDTVSQDGIVSTLPQWIDTADQLRIDPHTWIFDRHMGSKDGIHFRESGYEQWLSNQVINFKVSTR